MIWLNFILKHFDFYFFFLLDLKLITLKWPELYNLIDWLTWVFINPITIRNIVK